MSTTTAGQSVVSPAPTNDQGLPVTTSGLGQPSNTVPPAQGAGPVASDSTAIASGSVQTTLASTSPNSSMSDQTTAPTSTSKPSAPSYSPGALAGVAIACAIGSALLVGLVWFLMSRRSKGRRSTAILPGYSSKRQRPHSTTLAPPPAPRRQQQQQKLHQVVPGVDIDLDELPQEAPHDELRRSLSHIETDIKNWVLQFFQDSPSAVGKDTRQYQALLSLVSPGSTPHQSGGKGGNSETLHWLRQVHGKKQGILFLRVYVARLLFDRIDPVGDPSQTMLPRRILRFYQDMSLPSSSSTRAPGADPQLLPKEAHYWRSTTVSLMTRRRPSSFSEPDDENAETVANLGTQLLEVLQPMRNNRGSEQRCLEKFGSIARDVAQLGLRLFAQTHPVHVYWSPDRRGQPQQLVVFPGLKQYRLDSRQEICVVEPRVES
ncbi:3-oxoacyl- reductase [Apiospora arundinis]